MVQRIMYHPFGEPPQAGTPSGDEDRAWFVSRLSVADGWFMIDFLAIVPFDIILNATQFNSLARVARVGRLYKLVKLSRLFRFLKI